MISEKEYKKRRKKLLKKLSINSVAVLFGSEYKRRSNDTEYPYRQDSDFYYLTGFKEDKSSLVLKKDKNGSKVILFVEKRDKEHELWNGERLGVKRAKKRFLVDEICTYEKFESKVKEIAADAKSLYFDFSEENKNLECLRKGLSAYVHKDISHIVKMQRVIKSSAEIGLIKKALRITKEAHHRLISMQKEDRYEYELQAELEYIFKKRGAYSDAYSSIVAGGDNANILHYITNDKRLKKSDLILIDAGCEYEYYASDITRTIPVSGKFTQPQKELYQLVLDTQLKVIDMIKPGVLRSELHKKSEELLVEGMVRLGILKGNTEKIIKKKKHKKYYPHGIGHWMGIDVHDPSPYKYKNGKEIPFKEGMVLTIEPGIYCSKDDKSIPKKYRGIGIRIEENILVTKDGYENLSSDIVNSVEEIESMSRSCSSNP